MERDKIYNMVAELTTNNTQIFSIISRLIDDKVINVDDIDNYGDLYPILGAIYERESELLIDGFIDKNKKQRAREIKDKIKLYL